MNFFIAELFLASVRHAISFPARGCYGTGFWLVCESAVGASRESGAFLLGHRREGRVRVCNSCSTDLDPECLDTGIVRLTAVILGNSGTSPRRAASRSSPMLLLTQAVPTKVTLTVRIR